MPKVSEQPKQKNKYDAEGVLAKYRKNGFAPVEEPDGKPPRMEVALADAEVKALGNLMSKYAAWREYAEELHSVSTQKYVALKEFFEERCAVKIAMMPGDKITQKKAQVLADQEISTLNKDLIEAEMYVNLLANKVESYNNCIAVISREIARREQQVGNRFNA